MKGHFWNLKEKYKISNSTGEQEDYSYVNDEKREGKADNKNKNQKLSTEISVAEEDVVEPTSEKLVNVENAEDIVVSEQIEGFEIEEQQIEDPTVEKIDLSNENQQLKQRPRKGEIAFAIFIFILIALIFLFGVVGLIASLFMKIYSMVIPWLFYTSLIIVGIPVLIFLIFIISVAISDKKQDKVPAYGNS